MVSPADLHGTLGLAESLQVGALPDSPRPIERVYIFSMIIAVHCN